MEPVEAPPVAEPSEPADDAPEPEPEAREAARWRRKLREVEGERDSLRQQLDAVHEARVGDFLKVKNTLTVAALWAAGLTLDDVRDDSGQVTLELVQAAADTAAKKLGVQGRLPVAPSAAGQGNVGDPLPYSNQNQNTFAAAFGPRP